MLHLGSAMQSGGATIPISAAASAAQFGAARSTLGKAAMADALIKGGPGYAKPVNAAASKAQQMMLRLLGPSIGNTVNRQPAYSR